MASGKHTLWHHEWDPFIINQIELTKRKKKFKTKKVLITNLIELLNPIPKLKLIRLSFENGPFLSHFGLGAPR